MKRYAELSEEELVATKHQIYANASLLGLDEYESARCNANNNSNFGLCNDCKHLQLARTEFSVLFAKCFEFEIFLRENQKTIECTHYNQKNSLSLSEMKDIAYIIEVKNKEIGF
jgi:hypothetical protein